MEGVSYAATTRSLMYAMVGTRPNIAHAVGAVSHFMMNPWQEDWEAVCWIFLYLRGTSGMSLCFGRGALNLQGYVDSDLRGGVDTRRSTTGYAYTFGGIAMSWEHLVLSFGTDVCKHKDLQGLQAYVEESLTCWICFGRLFFFGCHVLIT